MPKNLADIRAYWVDAASQTLDVDGLRPTARDPYLQDVVETAMERWIWPSANLLDIGCGEGTSSLRFAKRAGTVLGLDYIPEFAERASQAATVSGATNTTFAAGDILKLGDTLQGRIFDIVVTIRCLINLPTWELQKEGISQVAKAVKPGGLYLLSEGWQEGWDELNRMRCRAGLEPITLVAYNRLLSRQALEAFIRPEFEIVTYHSVGWYLVMSRVFQPAFVAPERPRQTHPINKIAAQLYGAGIADTAFENCDYSGVYVLRKR